MEFQYDELYYFDGFHSGKHYFNGILYISKVGNNHKVTSINFDVLKKRYFIGEGDVFEEPRLDRDVRNFLYKLNNLEIDQKKELVREMMSFTKISYGV